MSRSIAPIILVSTLLAAPPCASADAVADLHALFDREWERDLSDNPVSATYLGDPRYNDRLPDISRAAEAARDAADAKVLDELARIPRDALPPAEQLNYGLFRHEYETRKAAVPFHRPFSRAASYVFRNFLSNSTSSRFTRSSYCCLSRF